MRRQALQDVAVAKRDVIEGLVKGLEVIRAFSDESMRLSASELADKVQLTRSACLLYTSPSPRDRTRSRMPSSA